MPRSGTFRTGQTRPNLCCWVACFTLLWLGGCYPVNPALSRFDPQAGYRYESLTATDAPSDSDNMFVALSLSGGGTRAAAFAYGVLEELHATPIGGGRTLLDEIDVISSVSGGSFAAAYYGLFGPKAFFTEFPDAVLYRSIERDLLLRVLAPWNWPRLLSPFFGRGDLADEYYDNHIFQRRTFTDLLRKRPFIILNATDISRGAQFSFTQEHFDRICSDLGPLTISRGVVASSAFPIGFTPITLKNYGKEICGYEAPPWVGDAARDLDVNPQLYDLAKTWRSYESNEHRPYVHLSDGGLADNIGLRAIETGISSSGSLGLYEKVNFREVERVVFIIVDAKPESEPTADRSARAPGIVTVLNAAATTPLENYSSDTVERIRLWFDEWDRAAQDFDVRRDGCDKLAAEICHSSANGSACQTAHGSLCYQLLRASDMFRPPHPKLYLIHVRFEAIPDERAKEELKGIGTRLQLPRREVDDLIFWARRLLRESGPYGDLVAGLRRASQHRGAGERAPSRP